MFTQKSTKLSTIMLALILGASVFMAGQAWQSVVFRRRRQRKPVRNTVGVLHSWTDLGRLFRLQPGTKEKAVRGRQVFIMIRCMRPFWLMTLCLRGHAAQGNLNFITLIQDLWK